MLVEIYFPRRDWFQLLGSGVQLAKMLPLTTLPEKIFEHWNNIVDSHAHTPSLSGLDRLTIALLQHISTYVQRVFFGLHRTCRASLYIPSQRLTRLSRVSSILNGNLLFAMWLAYLIFCNLQPSNILLECRGKASDKTEGSQVFRKMKSLPPKYLSAHKMAKKSWIQSQWYIGVEHISNLIFCERLGTFPSDVMNQSAFAVDHFLAFHYTQMVRLCLTGCWLKTAIWTGKKKVKAQGCSQCFWANEFRRFPKAHYNRQILWTESVEFCHHHMSPISSDAHFKSCPMQHLELLLWETSLFLLSD